VGGGAQLSLTGDVDAMWSRIVELEADNAHLRGMLKISEQESKRPGAAPTVMFDAAPGTVTVASSARDKVSLYANLFRSRRDVYAVRWDSDRTGRGGWMPAVQGGFRKGVRPADRHYLPLTEEVVTRHLSGDLEIGRTRCSTTTGATGSPPTSTATLPYSTRWRTSRPRVRMA